SRSEKGQVSARPAREDGPARPAPDSGRGDGLPELRDRWWPARQWLPRGARRVSVPCEYQPDNGRGADCNRRAAADEQSRPSGARLTVDDEPCELESGSKERPEAGSRPSPASNPNPRPRTPRPMSMGLGSGGARTVPATNRSSG